MSIIIFKLLKYKIKYNLSLKQLNFFCFKNLMQNYSFEVYINTRYIPNFFVLVKIVSSLFSRC